MPDEEKDYSGLLNKVKNYLVEYYEPVQEVKDASFHYTTEEVYRQLQRVLPGEDIFTSADVALWLHNAGFTFSDFGEMRLEWLMKRK